MNTRYRRLFWEQWRTAGILCLAVGLIMMLLQAGLVSLVLTLRLRADDAAYASAVFNSFTMLLAAALILVRQDGRGHLMLDFEPRLLHLPMPVLPVLLTAFLSRILFLGGLGFALLAIHGILHGAFPGVVLQLLRSTRAYMAPKGPDSLVPGMEAVVLTLHVFMIGQTLVWVRHSLTGLSYTLPLVLLGSAAWLHGYVPEDSTFRAFLEPARAVLVHPVSLLAVFPVSFFLSLLGVVWQRRDERHGLPSAGSILTWVNELRQVRVRSFESPLEAQLWYEQRRIGRLLPLLTLFLSLIFSVLLSVSPGLAFDDHTRFRYAPFAGLLAAALICGRLGLRPRSRLPFHRPQTATAASMALLLIQIRSLFFCFLLVSALSTLGMLFRGFDGVLLVQMLRTGDLDGLDALELLLRPAFTVTLLAWVLLWAGTWPFFVPMILFSVAYYLVPLFSETNGVGVEWVRSVEYYLMDKGFMLPVIWAVFCMTVTATGLAVKRGLYRWRHLLLGFLILENITVALLLLTPFLGAHAYAVLACSTLAAILVLPLAAAPLSLLHFRLKA